MWEAPYGDRRQEIVFIGADMDRAELERRLDAALVTPEEMEQGPASWACMDDPFAELFSEEEQFVEA